MKLMSEKFWVPTAVVLIPTLLMLNKAMRIDSREQHDFHMELRRRADFWEKGNAFSRDLRDHVHTAVMTDRGGDPKATN